MHFSESPRLTQPETPPETSKGAGRPATYSQEVADRVVTYCAESNLSLREICKRHDDVPSVRTVYRWRREHPEFDAEMRLAQDGRTEDLEMECIGIADGAAEGAKVIVNHDGKETATTVTTPIEFVDRQLHERHLIIARRLAGMAGAAAKTEDNRSPALVAPPEDDPYARAFQGWKARGLIEAK